jgi:ABC-type dipeptide/oligopeptide/nickel transport system ATPase component
MHPPAGCPFHPRCPLRHAGCERERPGLVDTGPAQVACNLVIPLQRTP